MKTKLDDVNLAILRALRDGRTSYRDIAADLGLSEVTVRTRATRLMDDDVLRVAGLTDVDRLPGHSLAVVAVKLNTPDLVRHGELFASLHGVISVLVVTGRFDLILTVLFNEEHDLLQFYTAEFAKCHLHVASIETFVVYKGFNAAVPYVL